MTSLRGLENATNLRTLLAANNQLTSLDGLENCSDLEYLYVYKNQLKSLDCLKNTTNLKVLMMCENQLTSLQGLECCKKLERLVVTRNPWLYCSYHCDSAKLWHDFCKTIHKKFLETCIIFYQHITAYPMLEVLDYLLERDATHWLHSSKINLIISIYKSCHKIRHQ